MTTTFLWTELFELPNWFKPQIQNLEIIREESKKLVEICMEKCKQKCEKCPIFNNDNYDNYDDNYYF